MMYTLKEFIQTKNFGLKMLTKQNNLFRQLLLPELIGKFFSRTNDVILNSTPVDQCSSSSLIVQNLTAEDVYCYCKGPEEGEMVACDNNDCKFKWFHMSCLKLSSLPKSKYWYCPDCRKLDQFK